ncbi:MAG: hypothetical protein E7342_03820 [Clostridiales bacterium]|nr:hypothetical protein [Clostridiales bacterium]
MKNYNQELIKKGAKDKETELITQRNLEIISIVKQFMPYENYDIFQELLDNYEKLIGKYSKYAYLLGFTRAIYEKD